MQSKPLTPLTAELYDYLLAVSVKESDVLFALRTYTHQHFADCAKMQIAPDQGQFMALLVRLIGAKRILEVGTFTGYSALAMAQALPDDGQLITCDQNVETSKIAQHFWQQAQLNNKIELKLGRAEDTLQQMSEQSDYRSTFDLVFLDANKSSHWLYYEMALQLLRPQGLVLIDNVFWHGTVADPSSHGTITRHVREFNHKISIDKRVELSMLAVGDGLTLARKVIESSPDD